MEMEQAGLLDMGGLYIPTGILA